MIGCGITCFLSRWAHLLLTRSHLVTLEREAQRAKHGCEFRSLRNVIVLDMLAYRGPVNRKTISYGLVHGQAWLNHLQWFVTAQMGWLHVDFDVSCSSTGKLKFVVSAKLMPRRAIIWVSCMYNEGNHAVSSEGGINAPKDWYSWPCVVMLALNTERPGTWAKSCPFTQHSQEELLYGRIIAWSFLMEFIAAKCSCKTFGDFNKGGRKRLAFRN